MYDHKRDWKTYNQRLINRGKVITILIEPSLLESESLRSINKGKVGRKFKFSTGLISAAFAVKCVFRIGYRQLEGFIEDISDKLHKSIPNFRTIWWRIDKMKNQGIKFGIHEGKHTIVAIDSTGLRPLNDGQYRAIKYGVVKEWVKLHAVVDIKTKEILNVSITKGDCHDNPQFKKMVKPIAPEVSAIFADKAYDAVETFEFCRENNIFPGIPVKLNATNHHGSSKSRMRRDMIESQLGLRCKPGAARRNMFLTPKMREENQKLWKVNVGYGRRSTIESSFSRYKRILGENLFSRKNKNIEKEIVAKINILNKFATN
jgi:transposase